MGIQKMFDNAMISERAEVMKTSRQLMLGELILKLEAITNKDLPIVFEDGFHPTGVDSWRGSYRELAIEYSSGNEAMTLAEFLNLLKETVGATFEGYKGGDFLMGKNTPLWVANYSYCNGFKQNGDRDSQGVIDVSVTAEAIVIETNTMKF